MMTKVSVENAYTHKKRLILIDLEKNPGVKEYNYIRLEIRNGTKAEKEKEIYFVEEICNKHYRTAVDIPGYKELLDYLVKQPGIIEMAKQLKRSH